MVNFRYTILFIIFLGLTKMPVAQEIYWYKCFKGTIDKYPFTLHLHKMDRTYSGYYYYNNVQRPMYILGDDTSASPGQIRLLSYASRAEIGNELFIISLRGDSLKGVWQKDPSVAGSLPVKAAKNATDKLQFDFVYASGSELLRPKLTESARASYEMATVWPKGNSAAVVSLKKIIATSLDIKDNPADIGPSLLAGKNKFLAEYLKENKAVPDSELVNFSVGYNQDMTNRLMVVYQSPTILTLANFSYSYTGGAHGNYVTSYTSVNPATGKKYTLSQVLMLTAAGRKQLIALLEKNFRKDRKLAANAPLTEAGLFENKLEPNSNYFLTGTGISFSYAPYEIGPYAMGEIVVFIPYSDFGKGLNPAFKR